MKRGRDDEKIMEPMFPRLHVSDRERGGPRAPPRNKMALYEQFSIPSQGSNQGVLPHNLPNTATVVPPPSTSQLSSYENGRFSSPHQHLSTHPAEKSYTGYSSFNPSPRQLEQKKKLDEEDFAVPIFVQTEIGQDHSKKSNGVDREEPKQPVTTLSNLRQEGVRQNENPKEYMAVVEQSVRSVKSSLPRENIRESTAASLNHEFRSRSQLLNCIDGNDVSNEPVSGIKSAPSSNCRRDSCPEEQGSPNNSTSDSVCGEDETCGSLRVGNADRGDDASETSMVDSVSGFDISPDDVVGIIGQKHFWKARRAIVNFYSCIDWVSTSTFAEVHFLAVAGLEEKQVFMDSLELFILDSEVQRSIAGSPHLLHKDGAYLGIPLKVSAAKKLPLEHMDKPSLHIVKHKDNTNNPNHNIESSDENAVGKTYLSSAQNVSPPSNMSTPVVTDTNMSPWCFPQPPGHQWLIPVLSPSEGLIYKPYPGHGFFGPFCEGYGHPGSSPMMGSFVNSAYGVPQSHHHNQSIGFPLTSTPFGHGYFPRYGMPVINMVNSGSTVEQANHFAGLGSHGQPGQSSGGGTNFNPEHQTSCNGAISNFVTNESEMRGSTGSSPSEEAQGFGVGHVTGGRNAQSFFPTSPAIPLVESERVPPVEDTDQPRRVIKVVPRNAMSATESAARIFRSIQEERKQYESV
ncbi:hydroxyproline-rich glycoprotein family protein [Actinidia rufa]|uniref:Hydroxyproline-rich glycoprotein family protein n=1 Tax=Actinidia rufa TaxID=165716 RepID=A0A7J0GCP5_9ERIC|nr:hydroxyproline-rich glycoprotein family protein [Actinidia rufa]